MRLKDKVISIIRETGENLHSGSKTVSAPNIDFLYESCKTFLEAGVPLPLIKSRFRSKLRELYQDQIGQMSTLEKIGAEIAIQYFSRDEYIQELLSIAIQSGVVVITSENYYTFNHDQNTIIN